MRYRIWLPVLLLAMGMACAKPEEKDTHDMSHPGVATDTPTTTYTLKVTFEGLVGYVETGSNVWALLPKADPAFQPPPFADTSNSNDYPRHYAVLMVPRKNVRDPKLPHDLYQIPIDGYDIELPVSAGTGPGLDSTQFHQTASDGVTDATVDELKAGMLDASPAQPNLLAARMKLPKTGFLAQVGGVYDFQISYPGQQGSGGFCNNPSVPNSNPIKKRVESVTWTSSSLSATVTLTLRPFSGAPTTLVLEPASGENTVEIKVVNQVARAFMDPNHSGGHWVAYRWFYNLSSSGTDCTKHYYPRGVFGGNRCPQKLYTE